MLVRGLGLEVLESLHVCIVLYPMCLFYFVGNKMSKYFGS
jgi:hypothetical protein